LNKYVLGCNVELSQSIYPVAGALISFSNAMRDGSDGLTRLDRSRLDWGPTAIRGNGGCLAIWATPDGDNPLGDGVSQISPGVGEIVELVMQWSKELADDSPMQLLSDEPQVNQLDKHLLQNGRDFFAHQAAERWQMRDA
jgi:hypothetical protein